MLTNSWIYDAIIYTYALSLLFYFSDTVGRNRRAKRMGTGLLVFVWVLQTIFLVVRIIRHQDVPIISSFEFMFLFSWLLVTASLAINRFFFYRVCRIFCQSGRVCAADYQYAE